MGGEEKGEIKLDFILRFEYLVENWYCLWK